MGKVDVGSTVGLIAINFLPVILGRRVVDSTDEGSMSFLRVGTTTLRPLIFARESRLSVATVESVFVGLVELSRIVGLAAGRPGVFSRLAVLSKLAVISELAA